MGMGTFAAKWGAGPTLVATLVGGASLGATVAVFQWDAIGNTIGILGDTVPRIGPAIAEGKAAVEGGAPGAVAPPVTPPVVAPTAAPGAAGTG